jgi:hypothetical protein
MKERTIFTLAAVAFFAIGYYFGTGALGWEFFDELIWSNPIGDAIHNAVLSFEEARIADFYGAIRLDFRFGILSLLAGFLGALVLPRRFDILPWFLAGGVFAHWGPTTIEVIPRISGAEFLVDFFLPDIVWDIALIPACMLGTAMGRLVRRRRIPRWRIRTFGILTALLALWLAAGIQDSQWLLPFATCGLLALLSIWLLIQTNVTIEKPQAERGSEEKPKAESGKPN